MMMKMKLTLIRCVAIIAMMSIKAAYSKSTKKSVASKATTRSTSLKRITTQATGAQEGHIPVNTKTTASLLTEFDQGFTYAYYMLDVFHGIHVTQAHFHCGAAGENGPVVAYLYKNNNKNGINVNGRLESRFLRNSDIISSTNFATTPGCGVAITNIASLYAAMKKGLIYFNVHTVANPNGEVRGQVFV